MGRPEHLIIQPRLNPSVIDAIGHTPLVALDRLTKGLEGRILAKLDFFNPGSSKKDRVAKQILEEARTDGSLKPGQLVMEMTSGNTGIGAAICCSVLGHPFVAVMSCGNSPERVRMIRALGGEVILVEQSKHSVPGQVCGKDFHLVEATARKLASERGAFLLDQFRRSGNTRAHELHTGPEIWEASGGTITAFCDFVGTGGTFAGLARAFRKRNPKIRGYVVEPQGSAVVAGCSVTCPNHRIQGGGYAMPLSLLDDAKPDGMIEISDQEAVEVTHLLAKTEGIFAGFSSGANVAAALKLLAGAEKGGIIAVIICDSGLKYLSSDLW